MIDRRHDIAQPRQCAGQPRLIAPIAAVTVEQHHQRMLPGHHRRVLHGRGADEHHIVGDQLGHRAGSGGVSDSQFQRAVVLHIGQGCGLEVDRALGSEGGSGQG